MWISIHPVFPLDWKFKIYLSSIFFSPCGPFKSALFNLISVYFQIYITVKFILHGVQFYRFWQILRVPYSHHNQDTEQSIDSYSVFRLPSWSEVSISLHPNSRQPVMFFTHIVLSFPEYHTNGIAQYTFWLSFFQLADCINVYPYCFMNQYFILFNWSIDQLYQYSSVCLFIHQLYQLLVIRNKAAINISIQIFVRRQVFASHGWMPRAESAGA